MLQDKNATCYPGFEHFLKGATYTAMPIEIQGNVITGRAPAAAIKFSIAIIYRIMGKEVADKVSREMLLIVD